MKILIPTDYSENAYRAFLYVQQLYSDSEHEFLFLNIQNSRHAGAILTVDLNDDLIQRSHLVMDELVRKTRLAFPNVVIQGLVTAGTFLDSIIEKSAEFRADIIALGTRGTNSQSGIFMGSNAANLIAHCPKPLIVVPKNAHLCLPQSALLAADFTKEPKAATYDPLLDLCYKYGTSLNILHVAKPNEPHFTLKDIPFSTERLEFTLHEKVDSDVEYAIIDFVLKEKIDLIGIVKSRGGFIHDLFHSSLTKQLGMHAETPLLVMV